uniref:Uncharacterized protein n=1 Tax=Rhizophora mucronata TaxID=61149 RepID=A0A2P2NIS6_RHIMU
MAVKTIQKRTSILTLRDCIDFTDFLKFQENLKWIEAKQSAQCKQARKAKWIDGKRDRKRRSVI